MATDRDRVRQIARQIFDAGVQSVMPQRLIAQGVCLEKDVLRIHDRDYPLRRDQKVHVFGSGKASVGMAASLLSILGERIAGGVIVTNQTAGADLSPLTVVQGSHPVPDANSIRGAELLLQGLAGLGDEDFFFYLLSGGASALIEKPLGGITLADMQETTRLLLSAGVPIQQVNAVRKHLSMVKGGRLGQATKAAGSVLVISDVIGDDLSVIGSGPLYCDKTTYSDCRDILERSAIWAHVSPSIRTVIAAGEQGDIPETPKEPNASITHSLIGTNRIALEGAKKKALQYGLDSHIITGSLAGEAREVARVLVAMARNINRTGEPFPPPCCLLFGGETTVTVHGSGKGGRNQELALAALAEIGTEDGIFLLSGGTDGIDGDSSAAGAFADKGLNMEAAAKGLSINRFLDDNNSNGFFQRVGGVLETGPTGTNVMDITLLIIDKEEP